MNKIVKLTVVLFLICAIVAGILGGINELTKDRIAEQNQAERPRRPTAPCSRPTITRSLTDRALHA